MKTTLKAGDKVIVVNDKPLQGNTVGPKLKEGTPEIVKEIFTDPDGFDHIDVGIVSPFNYVRCFETGKELPRGDSISWCHPSRFKLATNEN